MGLDPIGLLILLVIVGITYCLPPILDGFERKIKARIHSRIGPPVVQTWYDLLKLFSKKTYMPSGTYHIILLVVLYMLMISASIIILLVFSLVSISTALVTTLILFMISQVMFISIPFMSSNPFAIVGGSREVVLMLVNETTMVMVFSLILWCSNGFTYYGLGYFLGVISLLISAYVLSARPPFDLAEAEPELASGVIVELSGIVLGLLYYSNLLKRFLVKLFTSIIFLAPFVTYKAGSIPSIPLAGIVLSITFTCIVWLIYAVIAALLGRSRIDVAPVSLLKIYVPLLFSLIILSTVQ